MVKNIEKMAIENPYFAKAAFPEAFEGQGRRFTEIKEAIGQGMQELHSRTIGTVKGRYNGNNLFGDLFGGKTGNFGHDLRTEADIWEADMQLSVEEVLAGSIDLQRIADRVTMEQNRQAQSAMLAATKELGSNLKLPWEFQDNDDGNDTTCTDRAFAGKPSPVPAASLPSTSPKQLNEGEQQIPTISKSDVNNVVLVSAWKEVLRVANENREQWQRTLPVLFSAFGESDMRVENFFNALGRMGVQHSSEQKASMQHFMCGEAQEYISETMFQNSFQAWKQELLPATESVRRPDFGRNRSVQFDEDCNKKKKATKGSMGARGQGRSESLDRSPPRTTMLSRQVPH